MPFNGTMGFIMIEAGGGLTGMIRVLSFQMLRRCWFPDQPKDTCQNRNISLRWHIQWRSHFDYTVCSKNRISIGSITTSTQSLLNK